MADDREGYWNVLYLFHKAGPNRYALAGYMTLFYFDSPFRKPRPGTIVRVCQVLILPPYQRQGHGRKMLHCVHDLTVMSVAKKPMAGGKPPRSPVPGVPSDVVEINVEDPAPSFVALRNRVDYERFLRIHGLVDDHDGSNNTNSENNDVFSTPKLNSSAKKKQMPPSGGSKNNRFQRWFDEEDVPAVVARFSGAVTPRLKNNGDNCSVLDERFFTPLSDDKASVAASRAKITVGQIHIVYELYKLMRLRQQLEGRRTNAAAAAAAAAGGSSSGRRSSARKRSNNNKSNGDDGSNNSNSDSSLRDELEKRYRLMVKKRLNKTHREEMGIYRGNKQQMQAHLAKLYDETVRGYDAILLRSSASTRPAAAVV